MAIEERWLGSLSEDGDVYSPVSRLCVFFPNPNDWVWKSRTEINDTIDNSEQCETKHSRFQSLFVHSWITDNLCWFLFPNFRLIFFSFPVDLWLPRMRFPSRSDILSDSSMSWVCQKEPCFNIFSKYFQRGFLYNKVANYQDFWSRNHN